MNANNVYIATTVQVVDWAPNDFKINSPKAVDLRIKITEFVIGSIFFVNILNKISSY